MSITKRFKDIEGLQEAECVSDFCNIYQLAMPSRIPGTVIIERLYDGGGTIPYSELFCCGDELNLLHWNPSNREAGYYKIDRKIGMVRLASPPAGPIMVKYHIIPE